LAVTSVVLGALSVVVAVSATLATWLFLTLIPLAGGLVGWAALKQIRKAPAEWIGRELAWTGVGLSAGLWLAGSCFAWFLYAERVPPDYQRIEFAVLQPDRAKPTEPIPQTVLDMQDRKVFIRGYMQPRRQRTGIKDFVLCPANGECPFCIPNPTRTEMIRVTLLGDREMTYTTHLIGVAGKFRVDLDDPNGIPYGLEAEYVK
jgi:hypothetical protein